MDLELHETAKGSIALYRGDKAERLRGAPEFLDLLMGCGAPTLALHAGHLPEGFLDLRTRIAGEILQKVSNYRKRLLIMGEFEGIESRSLRDFIRESNSTGQVVFAPDLEGGLGLLK